MSKKNRFKNSIGLAMVLLGLLSCNKEGDPLMTDYGYLKFSFTEDNSEIVVGTKTTDPIFAVNVLNSEGVVVKTCTDHRELESEPLRLKTGTYYINATSGKQTEAAFGKPFYKGSDTIDVVVGGVTTSEVICSLSQVKVSIAVDQSVIDNFKEYIVTVSNTNEQGSLIFSSSEGTIGDEGYFNCTGTLEYDIYLINNKDEVSNNELKGTIQNVKPKEHYILNLTVSNEDAGGATTPDISGDGSTNDKEHDIIINLNKKAKPKYSTNGFNLANPTSICLGSTLTWQVNVEAKAGVETLFLTHNSLALSNMGIPYSFNIVGMNPADKNAIAALGLTWGEVTEGTQTVTLDFSDLITTLPLGEYAFGISTFDKQSQLVEATFKFTIIPDVETSTMNVEPWAKRAFFHGVFNTITQPAGMGFEYKKASENTWTKITGGYTVTGNAYSIEVTGLEPATAYVMRTMSDKESSNEIEFTTERADQIENMSFDNWYKNGRHYYANIDLSAEHFWWDSGNEGANLLSEVNPTQPTSNVAVAGTGKQAAQLKTETVFGILASGSLFLGDFLATEGTSGASLNFGRPYACRPLSLKGYYSYAPVAINKTKAPYNGLSGQPDVCQIYVILADWPQKYFAVNTSTGTFIDFENDSHIIAYGTLENNTNTNGYIPFEIPLTYRNKRTPTCCVIVCAASKYGDYFTGGVGSLLLVDEFEFTF